MSGFPVLHHLPELAQTHIQYPALTYCFPNLEPVRCSMSGSNCCFLTCIPVSQEAGKVVWYSHLLENFPQFVVIHTVTSLGFPDSSNGKESACNGRDLGLIPGLGRSPGEGHGNALQYSHLENSMGRGAWRAPVYGVTKSQTQLSDYYFHFYFLHTVKG